VSSPVARCSCARIPLGSLGALAALRAREDVRCATDGTNAWLHWRAGDGEVLIAVLAIQGSVLFERGDDGEWRRAGERLPGEAVLAASRPLREFIELPAIDAVAPAPLALAPAKVRLVAADAMHATSAALAPLAAVAKWAETATTAQLESLLAARAGELVLLFGERIPLLEGAERFHGERVFAPLGKKIVPALGEADLAAALGAREDELVFVREGAVEIVPERALRPLTRASVRLAVS
jgi:hypothetical protein